MNFSEYQAFTESTVVYNRDSPNRYIALGAAGELGEVSEKVGHIVAALVLANGHLGLVSNQLKKVERDDENQFWGKRIESIKHEFGGVFWYLARICSENGIELESLRPEGSIVSDDERGDIRLVARYLFKAGQSLNTLGLVLTVSGGEYPSVEIVQLTRSTIRWIMSAMKLLDIDIESVLSMNAEQLSGRRDANTLKGDGDIR